MARAILTGELVRVKDGEYNGKPDVSLIVESGDDNVMVSVPAQFQDSVEEMKSCEGEIVQIPCIVTMARNDKGGYMRWRMNASLVTK